MRHPSGRPTIPSPLRLYGCRVMLRPLVPQDFPAWREVRQRNEGWLTPWEPRRPLPQFDPTVNRNAFASRCAARERDSAAGLSFGFGLFVDAESGGGRFCGEVNINHILRGAIQTGTIGYWIDERCAGQGLVAEGVVVVAEFAFERLWLHRLEICIVPRNHNSRRVMEKLAIREEGIAVRALEINGVWEDHVRYGFTAEEWQMRANELRERWLLPPGANSGARPEDEPIQPRV
jgi:ribosomal-protein-alanine N-acetyltransferase